MTDYSELSFDDVGTRRDHLMEMHKLWTDGLSILMTQMNGYATDEEKERKAKLENAIELLEAYITKDFAFGLEYGQEIKKLPKNAAEIKDEKDTQADGYSN